MAQVKCPSTARDIPPPEIGTLTFGVLFRIVGNTEDDKFKAESKVTVLVTIYFSTPPPNRTTPTPHEETTHT